MASWSALSLDIKKKVVRELDLLTRCRLKICSTSDRKLVNSVKLNIKNVRIGFGDDACLLMVHTGIGEFVKLDLELIKGKVVIKRSINSRDEVTEIPTSYTDPLVLLCHFMKSLLTSPSKNVYLNVLEVEFNESENKRTLMAGMKKLLNGVQFRAKTLMINETQPTNLSDFITPLCMKKDLKKTHRICVNLDVSVPIPTSVSETYLPGVMTGGCDNQVTHVFSKDCTADHCITDMAKSFLKLTPGTYMTERQRFADPKGKFEMVQAPVQRLTDESQVKRVIERDLVYRHTLTPCGYSMSVIHKSKEHTVDWKSETCGLGILCQKCTDPFEFFYFNDLPNRYLHESNWLNIFKTYESNEDEDTRNDIEMLVALLEDKPSMKKIILDMKEKDVVKVPKANPPHLVELIPGVYFFPRQ